MADKWNREPPGRSPIGLTLVTGLLSQDKKRGLWVLQQLLSQCPETTSVCTSETQRKVSDPQRPEGRAEKTGRSYQGGCDCL